MACKKKKKRYKSIGEFMSKKYPPPGGAKWFLK